MPAKRKSTKKSGRKSTKRQYSRSKKPIRRSRSKAPAKRYRKKVAPSPVGYGIHARYTRIGVIREGTDGNLWIVTRRSNGSHFWKRYN